MFCVENTFYTYGETKTTILSVYLNNTLFPKHRSLSLR